MNIFQKIKAYFTVKSEYEKTKEVYMKAGWKTTEFWITLLGGLVNVFGAVKGIIPAGTASIVGGVLITVYTTMRNLAKQPDITTFVDKSTTINPVSTNIADGTGGGVRG